MNRDRVSYCINGTGRATNLTTYKYSSEQSIIDNFKKYCASDNVKEAFCQIDRNSHEQVSEGMTTYGVRTKDTKLMTISIHENDYEICKDQMSILTASVNKAQEKISEKRKDIVRKVVAGGVVVVAVGLSVWAGKIKLEDWNKDKEKNQNKTSTESTTEISTEDMTEFATPVDATTETDSNLEDKYSAEEIKKSIEEANKKAFDEQMEELRQRRIELGLNPDSTIDNSDKDLTGEPSSKNNSDDGKFHPSYGYTEVVDDAKKTQQVIDEYNQFEMDRQKKELQELRKSYEEEYKGKSY